MKPYAFLSVDDWHIDRRQQDAFAEYGLLRNVYVLEGRRHAAASCVWFVILLSGLLKGCTEQRLVYVAQLV